MTTVIEALESVHESEPRNLGDAETRTVLKVSATIDTKQNKVYTRPKNDRRVRNFSQYREK